MIAKVVQLVHHICSFCWIQLPRDCLVRAVALEGGSLLVYRGCLFKEQNGQVFPTIQSSLIYHQHPIALQDNWTALKLMVCQVFIVDSALAALLDSQTYLF